MECQWIRNHLSALNAVLIGIIIALFSYFIDVALIEQTKNGVRIVNIFGEYTCKIDINMDTNYIPIDELLKLNIYNCNKGYKLPIEIITDIFEESLYKNNINGNNYVKSLDITMKIATMEYNKDIYIIYYEKNDILIRIHQITKQIINGVNIRINAANYISPTTEHQRKLSAWVTYEESKNHIDEHIRQADETRQMAKDKETFAIASNDYQAKADAAYLYAQSARYIYSILSARWYFNYKEKHASEADKEIDLITDKAYQDYTKAIKLYKEVGNIILKHEYHQIGYQFVLQYIRNKVALGHHVVKDKRENHMYAAKLKSEIEIKKQQSLPGEVILPENLPERTFSLPGRGTIQCQRCFDTQIPNVQRICYVPLIWPTEHECFDFKEFIEYQKNNCKNLDYACQ